MPITRRMFLGAAASVPAVSFLSISPALAAAPEVFAVDSIAIRGADAAAYFTGSGPQAGSPEHTTTWKGAAWQFANSANLEMFLANPLGFAPQFGGYCAYAASLGYLAPTLPEAWTIYEGKLYLNANLRARELWLQDVPGNIAKGNANWPGILG